MVYTLGLSGISPRRESLNSVVYALWDTMKLSSNFSCLEECANAPSVLFELLKFSQCGLTAWIKNLDNLDLHDLESSVWAVAR